MAESEATSEATSPATSAATSEATSEARQGIGVSPGTAYGPVVQVAAFIMSLVSLGQMKMAIRWRVTASCTFPLRVKSTSW